MSGTSRILQALSAPRVRFWLEVLLFGLGLGLRVEHALTFDGPARGADYAVHLEGVRWMGQHWRPFNLDPTINTQVGSYPPLWYALSALVLKAGAPERALAAFAVIAWIVRHYLLGRCLRHLAPKAVVGRLCALAINAVLPLAVLIDGKVNPEGLHSLLFMPAAYMLFRLERDLASGAGACVWKAVAFGVFAGLALLVKATGALLVLAMAIVFVMHGATWLIRGRGAAVLSGIVRPALFAAVVWWALVGFWCGPNLIRHGHPFPHLWDVSEQSPELTVVPTLYRRPLGWALPFYWKEYWNFPIIRSPSEPLPNFWAAEISGTWSDLYNRGFCRLRGGETTDRVWGGLNGFMHLGSADWSVSLRCVKLFASLLHVGVWITLASVVAVFHTAIANLRSNFRSGSLALPLLIVLCVWLGMTFAMKFPFDNMAVLNPRYLLPAVTPMCACVGFSLGRLEGVVQRRGTRGALSALALVAAASSIMAVAVLLLYERFGA